MSPTPEAIERQLISYLREEVECRVLGPNDGRIGCLTPLEYPNRDNVVVWVRHNGNEVEVTDYGEALPELPKSRRARDVLEEGAALIARSQDVELEEGRLTVHCSPDTLAEHVWNVATAASQIALLARATKPPSRQNEELAFRTEVRSTLRSRRLPIEERELPGKSGHLHKARIFLPTTESVLEPVRGHWAHVTATYAKFGDLGNANGYRLFSVLMTGR